MKLVSSWQKLSHFCQIEFIYRIILTFLAVTLLYETTVHK